jgi:hypothetical protein
VIALQSAFGVQLITSVVAMPVSDPEDAEGVTTVAQEFAEIALVPRVAVPLAKVYVTVPPPPNATDEESVPVKVSVLLTEAVLPLATVSVPVDAVMLSPLMLV